MPSTCPYRSTSPFLPLECPELSSTGQIKLFTASAFVLLDLVTWKKGEFLPFPCRLNFKTLLEFKICSLFCLCYTFFSVYIFFKKQSLSAVKVARTWRGQNWKGERKNINSSVKKLKVSTFMLTTLRWWHELSCQSPDNWEASHIFRIRWGGFREWEEAMCVF